MKKLLATAAAVALPRGVRPVPMGIAMCHSVSCRVVHPDGQTLSGPGE